MNTKSKLRSFILLVSLFLLPCFSGVVLAQSDHDRVFIFGDSLSDSGNIYALTGETSKAPYLVVPSFPYAQGGHHFSNGRTWAERLAESLQNNKGGKASRDNPGMNGNYAHGGGRARANSGSAAPSSAQQVGMFLGDHGTAPSDALYVVQFGGNDLRDALFNPPEAGNILQAAVGELAGTIQALYFAGGRNFMVANAPNIGHAPAVKLAGPAAVAGAFFLTDQYNLGLEGALSQLEASLPGISIRRLDMGGFIDEVVASPADFGLTNATTPCLMFFADSDANCSNPEEHLFWDGLHPTAAAHKALAARAAEALN